MAVNTHRVSVAVMAHPRRADVVPHLVDRLSVAGEQVVWDRRNDEWDTGRRSLLAFDPHATHHLVVQDDALVCLDLVAGLEKALPHTPAESIVSLYVGMRRPVVQMVQQAVNRATTQRAAWIVMDQLLWGVGIVVPARTVEAMVDWCDRLPFPQYDRRISEYYEKVLGWPIWCTWPTLVDHRTDTASLLGHGRGRRSHQFAGADQSALGIDWSAPVVDMRRPSTQASAPGAGRATVEYDRTRATVNGGHGMGLHDPYNQRARVKAYYQRQGRVPADPPEGVPPPPPSNVDDGTVIEREEKLSDLASALQVPDAALEAGAYAANHYSALLPSSPAPAVTAAETAGSGGSDGAGTSARPRGNASQATWHAYLLGLGYLEAELAGKTRDELIGLADKHRIG